MTTTTTARAPGALIPRAYPSKFDRGATHRVEIDGQWLTAETMDNTAIVWTGDAAVTRAAKAVALVKIVEFAYGKPVDSGYVIAAEELSALVEKFGDRVCVRAASAAPSRSRRKAAGLGVCTMCYSEPATHAVKTHGALCDDCDLSAMFW